MVSANAEHEDTLLGYTYNLHTSARLQSYPYCRDGAHRSSLWRQQESLTSKQHHKDRGLLCSHIYPGPMYFNLRDNNLPEHLKETED